MWIAYTPHNTRPRWQRRPPDPYSAPGSPSLTTAVPFARTNAPTSPLRSLQPPPPPLPRVRAPVLRELLVSAHPAPAQRVRQAGAQLR